MFRFRLQNVLDLREKQEREIASQLVQALSLKQEAQNALNTLQATRVASTEQATREGTVRSVGELANLAFMLEHLDGHIANANDAVQVADETVAQTKEALSAAFQDRHVLDRLRARHQETHRTEAEQLDRRTMDDIAITRHTQNGTISTPTNTSTSNTP